MEKGKYKNKIVKRQNGI